MAPRMSREARKQAICDTLRHADKPLRVAEIAAAMGLRKTPYLWNLIEELLAEGRITEGVTILWNGRKAATFSFRQ